MHSAKKTYAAKSFLDQLSASLPQSGVLRIVLCAAISGKPRVASNFSENKLVLSKR